MWRYLYQRTTPWTMRMIHLNTLAAKPLEPTVEEPNEIEEFVEVLLAKFQATSATNLDRVRNFKPDPKESLYMLETRFNLITLSLEENNLISSRMLALALIEHLPGMVRVSTTNEMIRQDKARTKNGESLTKRDELMSMARGGTSAGFGG